MTLDTARLRLVPFQPAQLLALNESAAGFAERFGLPAADGLRGLAMSDDVSPDWLARLEAASDADPWTFGFALVHREREIVIGLAGFKGPPDAAGAVEVAYGVVPAFEGQGFASEALEGLLAYARQEPAVRTVRAHTLPFANGSTRVLERCGFARVAQVEDPDDGPVWRWERAAAGG